MKARVKWLEDMTYVGESGSGHAVVIDGPPELGGHNLGVRPMEMLLLGLGGCTSVDVIQILKKARQAVTDCVVEIEAERGLPFLPLPVFGPLNALRPSARVVPSTHRITMASP